MGIWVGPLLMHYAHCLSTDKSNFYVVQNLVISLAKNKKESTLPVDFLMGIRNFLFQEWANA